MQTIRLLFALLLLSLSLNATGGNWNIDEGGLLSRGTGAVIKGYDPVAYFTEGRPVKGSLQYAHQHDGQTFWFTSEDNRRTFAAAPERYAPQYGGYCAWAVSQGYTADIDPAAWAIHDGRLFLNYSKSVQANWSKDIPGHVRQADANWPQLNR